jgi:hypothetical protein
MIAIKITPAAENELNKYVTQHLDNCDDFLDYENDNLMDGFEPFAPYCGCGLCRQRETLHAAFKWLEDNDFLRLEYDDSNEN